MAMDKVNGCGACSGFFAWLRPPHHEFFIKECTLHDELYNLGGSAEDRRKADIRLFQDMVARSSTYFTGRKPSSHMRRDLLCYLSYYAVRAFGRSQFNYK